MKTYRLHCLPIEEDKAKEVMDKLTKRLIKKFGLLDPAQKRFLSILFAMNLYPSDIPSEEFHRLGLLSGASELSNSRQGAIVRGERSFQVFTYIGMTPEEQVIADEVARKNYEALRRVLELLGDGYDDKFLPMLVMLEVPLLDLPDHLKEHPEHLETLRQGLEKFEFLFGKEISFAGLRRMLDGPAKEDK